MKKCSQECILFDKVIMSRLPSTSTGSHNHDTVKLRKIKWNKNNFNIFSEFDPSANPLFCFNGISTSVQLAGAIESTHSISAKG